jgi:large subunit ribosomal protein L17
LFGAVSSKIGDRPGGYTRVIKMGNRLGDNADMAMIELVDFNEVYSNSTDNKKKSTRRRKSKKSTEDNLPDVESEKKEDSVTNKKDN